MSCVRAYLYNFFVRTLMLRTSRLVQPLLVACRVLAAYLKHLILLPSDGERSNRSLRDAVEDKWDSGCTVGGLVRLSASATTTSAAGEKTRADELKKVLWGMDPSWISGMTTFVKGAALQGFTNGMVFCLRGNTCIQQ